MHVVGVTHVSSVTTGEPAADAGSANPDQSFRFDPTLGGYIYNLKTTGYAPGTYRINFTVGADPHVYNTQFQVR